MGLDIQRRYHLKMLTRALLTGIYDSQMQYGEYISHCRRMLLGILLKQHLKLQREKKTKKQSTKLSSELKQQRASLLSTMLEIIIYICKKNKQNKNSPLFPYPNLLRYEMDP